MKRPITLSTLLVCALVGVGALGGLSSEETRSANRPRIAEPEAKADLIDTLTADPNFSTLVQLVKAAGLVDALKGKGPFTIFAPTNEAFARLPQGSVEALQKPESKARLQRVLKYHIIPARVPSADLLRLRESSKTLEGGTFHILTKGGKIKVGVDDRSAVAVSKTDTNCSNGVIHTLDGVMLPAEPAGNGFKAPDSDN